MEFHAAAMFFPLMTGEEFERFKADINAHGLRVPVQLWQGKIIDGRNRYRACQELGVDVRTEELVDLVGKDPTAYVLTVNLHRRHLSASQRAIALSWLRPGDAPTNSTKRSRAARFATIDRPPTRWTLASSGAWGLSNRMEDGPRSG